MYDLIIIGAGPAGLAASIYASRYKISHLIFGAVPGGQAQRAGTVENYPGFVKISGPELVQKFLEQVQSYGVEVKQEEVKKVEKGELFRVKTNSGNYESRSLILAMGASYQNLEVPGEKELVGKGVSYCANCDAPFFKEKIVAVVGGGNAAVSGALHVVSFASKVYLIHRREEFRADPYRVEKLGQNPNIEQILSTNVKEIKGTEKVEAIVLDKPYQGNTLLKVEGVFIEIGQVPSTVLAKELGVKLDEKGYILVGSGMETDINGVFAAGDLAAMPGELLLRQIVTSVADGARAAASAYQFLKQRG